MIVALFICLAFKPFLKDLHSKYATFNLKQKVIGSFKYMALLAVLAFIIKQIMLYSQITSTFLIVGISCALLLFLYDNCKDNLKNGLIFFVLAIACLLFWSLYFLIPTGLTLFANYNIDRNFFGYVIPPAWLPNINSVLIIFGAPLLGILFKRLDVNHKWTPIRKLLIGLCSMALAFFALFYGILIAKFEIGCDGTFNMKDLKKFCVNCLTFINLDNLDDTAAKDLCVKLHKFAVNIQKDPFPVL